MKTIAICVATLLVVGLSFIAGRSTKKGPGADERALWSALVNIRPRESACTNVSNCGVTNCGFHTLLRIWHQVDSAERVLNRPVEFTTDLPLVLAKKPKVVSELDEFRHALLPVLAGALGAEDVSFPDYLFLRKDVSNALKTATVEENLARFMSSVRVQEENFAETAARVKEAKPIPIRHFEFPAACQQAVLEYLKRGDHRSAYFDSFVAQFGPIYIPIYTGR